MEESVSGFEVRDGWVEVVEHGERIAQALRDVREDADLDESLIEEFEEWRPKTDERLSEDVNEKTADQASIAEGSGEKAGKSPDEDIREAGDRLAESYEQLEDDQSEAVEKWGESIDHVRRAADTAGRKAIRGVEDAVYRNVMTRVAPYYFDNELVSANIQRLDDEPSYALEINVNDDDVKMRVSNQLADYEQDVDRWHVNTPKTTEQSAAVEGVDPPEENGDDTAAETN
ncbi:DUF5828 family protein [Halococcoides cellulosivorans]|uniref:Uncharacterized protein n=1 Tax=Halococcoides cellulosivorans TaxID=1679096 RepID=A0A2R4X230_9EURY|nr:DUF5828 family protein [Halococcoides cellulosivorans]AWB27783.1 hypothetical protein HARCEL1_08705 [Halococcoides cellulosivorans]